MLETVLLRDAAISVPGGGAVNDEHIRMRMDVAEHPRKERERLFVEFRLVGSRIGVSGDRHFESKRILAPGAKRSLVDEPRSMRDMADHHHRLLWPLA